MRTHKLAQHQFEGESQSEGVYRRLRASQSSVHGDIGQEHVNRCLEVASAGGHNVIMIGRGQSAHGIVKKEDATKKGMIVLVTLILFMAGTKDLYAYTYLYDNKTCYLIRVIVEVYNGEDRASQIEPNGSYSFSTDLLLKSWKADAFVDNQWQQILHLTCDFLLGNHSFSIHVDEARDRRGTVTRSWYTTNP